MLVWGDLCRVALQPKSSTPQKPIKPLGFCEVDVVQASISRATARSGASRIDAIDARTRD